jgi:hypothetical protein
MNMDKETYRQVVSALAVIGLTLEHADYLFDNDSKALVQVDEALMAAGIDAPELRDRAIDRIIEDTEAFDAAAAEEHQRSLNDTPNESYGGFSERRSLGLPDISHDRMTDTLTEEEQSALAMADADQMARDWWANGRHPVERRSFEERRAYGGPATRRGDGDRRIGFVPTHHGADKIDPLDRCNWP